MQVTGREGGGEKSKEGRKVYICRFCSEGLCSILCNRDLRSGLLPYLSDCQYNSDSLFSSCPAIVQAEWSSPSSGPQNKLAVQVPPFAVEEWGFCYSSEQGRATAWTSASHSSAKAYGHCPVACLRRASLEYEFVQVLSLWPYSHAEQNNLISQMVLAGTGGCIPSEGGFQDHKMSLSHLWLLFSPVE